MSAREEVLLRGLIDWVALEGSTVALHVRTRARHQQSSRRRCWIWFARW
jgi:hypothetical protein